MNKILALLTAVALTVITTLVPAPAGATTQVWSCHLNYNSYQAWAWCDYGLGGVRAAGYCWNGSYNTLRYGPWKPAGQISLMSCVQGESGELLNGAWYETF